MIDVIRCILDALRLLFAIFGLYVVVRGLAVKRTRAVIWGTMVSLLITVSGMKEPSFIEGLSIVLFVAALTINVFSLHRDGDTNHPNDTMKKALTDILSNRWKPDEKTKKGG